MGGEGRSSPQDWKVQAARQAGGQPGLGDPSSGCLDSGRGLARMRREQGMELGTADIPAPRPG